jgi:phage shock protein C
LHVTLLEFLKIGSVYLEPGAQGQIAQGMMDALITVYTAETKREVSMSKSKLCRTEDKMIAGVCGGIAEYLGWPTDRVRLLYVLVSLLSAAFPGTLVYIILWFAMPKCSEVARA